MALNGINVTISGLNTTSPTATGRGRQPDRASDPDGQQRVAKLVRRRDWPDGPGGGALSLVVSGGSLTLTGNSSAFSGTTDVTGTATLTLASLNALQNSTLNMTVANSVLFTPGVATYNDRRPLGRCTD